MSKSISATILSHMLTFWPKRTPEECEEVFEKKLREGEKPALAPRTLKTRYVDSENGRMFYANEKVGPQNVVFYIHGGAYQHEIMPPHWHLIKRLIAETDCLVVAPAYRLVPFGTWKEVYDLIVPVYREYCEKYAGSKIILMGDSAGGGYSLALAEGLAERGIDQPDELILLSPWVDVTMSSPKIKDYENVDPMLTVTMGRVSGEAWAGTLPTDDWHVSPINGDLSKLRNVTIFVGDRELFTPDDTLLYEKLSGNENVRLIVGHGQNHVYPVYPTLEGRIAMEQIRNIMVR